MRLYLMRHGEAAAGKIDHLRPLTDYGAASVGKHLQHLQNRLMCRHIWHSPFLRAQMTASIASDILGIKKQVRQGFEPDANPSLLYDVLNAQFQDDLLIVTHNPFVSRFIRSFCGDACSFIGMDTGSVVAIEYDIAARDLGRLLWTSHIADM